MTAGSAQDCSQPDALLDSITAAAIIADKAYDSDAVVAKIGEAGALAVIPPKSNRKDQRDFDKDRYKERNIVERFLTGMDHRPLGPSHRTMRSP